MNFINHGTLLDLYDYKKLIELQANTLNREIKVVKSRKYNTKEKNISRGYTLNRKLGR